MHSPPNAPADLSALPYQDTKPQGAADFYFGINATFRFIRAQFGMPGLIAYWQDLGAGYFKPVWTRWKELGLPGIESYWRAFFAAEPGSNVAVQIQQTSRQRSEVVLEVKTCPAIHHLREHGREIVPEFCQQCYFINATAAEQAGFAVRVTGGNGSCRQRVFVPTGGDPAQNLEEISRC